MSSPTGLVKKGPSLKVLNVELSSKRKGRGIFSIIIDAPCNREGKTNALQFFQSLVMVS